MAAVFPPLALVGALAVLVGGMGLTSMYSRSVNHWSWAVTAGVLALVFLVSAVTAWELWGVAFDLSDSSADVPVALKVALGGSYIGVLLGLVGFVAVAAVSAVRANRHARDTRHTNPV
ncbi:hypothetical protein RI685_16415 (plasmid) [Clavibacter michiganensis]|uniref:hypothetical protein n=1 Tax=Clavibacter michiganensis TaxID=28447 RepID=UPI003DA0A9AD